MFKALRSTAMGVFTVATLTASMAVVTVAQDATPGTEDMAAGTARPAHIHAGTCESLGDVVFPLNDVTLPGRTMASPAATPDINLVSESTTTVDVALEDILAEEHAINVHQSAEDIDVYIACGNVTGTPEDGMLDVNLGELNDSGYTGQATLVANDDVSTTITVTIIETALATPVGSPAA